MSIGALLTVALAAAAGPGLESGAPASVSTADRLAAHIQFLASDSLSGRAPGAPGGVAAAHYLAARLEEAGLEPAGPDGSWYQEVPIHEGSPLPDSKLQVEIGVPASASVPDVWFEPRPGEDYLLGSTGDGTSIARPVPIVFVGYGIAAPEYDYDDYRSVDVRGAVAAYLAGEPASTDPDFFAAERRTVHSFLETKQRQALAHGARGSILIWRPRDGERWSDLQREYWFPQRTLAYDVSRGLNLILEDLIAPSLFHGADHTLSDVFVMDSLGTMRSFPLPTRLSFRGRFRERDFASPNVVGFVRGGDPALADEWIVLSAHYDGLGVGPPVAGDSIYNGAIDNASGCAALVEIARRLAQHRAGLRRSVVVLFTTGEENGLLGSRYYCDHPLVPLQRTVAALNIDGLAFLDEFDDVVGVCPEGLELDGLLERTAEAQGLRVAPIPEVFSLRDEFLRSDQYAFAAAGVPAFLVQEGLSYRHWDPEPAVRLLLDWGQRVYHSPGDDLNQPIRMEAASEHLALLAALAESLSCTPRPPRWQTGSPYSAAQLRARAEVASRPATSIRVSGSDSMAPLARRWAVLYMNAHPGVSVSADGGGTAEGVRALIDGKVDLCTASRTLTAEETRELLERRGSLGIRILCARDALSIYLSEENPVQDLALDQVAGLLTGKILSWRSVGGVERPVRVYVREPNSGTRGFLQEQVLLGESFASDAAVRPGTSALAEAVAHDPGGIGFGGLIFGEQVKHCRINGVPPTPDHVRDGSYPIARYLYLYSAETPSGAIASFVDFVLSPEGQAAVEEMGYVPLWGSPERP